MERAESGDGNQEGGVIGRGRREGGHNYEKRPSGRMRREKGIGLYRAREILLQTPTGGAGGIDEIKEEYA